MNDINLYRRFLSTSEAIRSKFRYESNRAFFLGYKQLSTIKLSTDNFIEYSVLPGLEDQKIRAGGIYFGELAQGTLVVTEPMFETDAQFDVQLKVLGIRLLQLLGIEELIIFGTGEYLNNEADEEQLFWAEDHINLSGNNPLVGANVDEFGERFPDMTGVYDSELTSEGLKVTEKLGFKIKKGVWASTWGNSYLPENIIQALLENEVTVISNEGMQEVIAATHGKLRTALTFFINTGEKENELLYKLLRNLCSGSK